MVIAKFTCDCREITKNHGILNSIKDIKNEIDKIRYYIAIKPKKK